MGVRRCPRFDQLDTPLQATPQCRKKGCSPDNSTALRQTVWFFDRLIGTSLLERARADSLEAEYSPPDIEYVPLLCFGRTHGACGTDVEWPPPPRPRLGRFTAMPNVWGQDGLKRLQNRLCTKNTAPRNTSTAPRRRASAVGDGSPLAVLTVEAPVYVPRWAEASSAEVRMRASRLPPPASGLHFVQVPYPSSGTWVASSHVSKHVEGEYVSTWALKPALPPPESRSALAALVANTYITKQRDEYVGGQTRLPNGSSTSLRAILQAECNAAPLGTCLSWGADVARDKHAGQQTPADGLYARAVFCLQPWGDTATRKGFWDALAAGCIPAVFTRAGWGSTDSWFGAHGELSVRIPLEEMAPGRRGALGYLASLPRPKVRALQRRIARERGRTVYSLGLPKAGDAMDLVIDHLASIFERSLGGEAPKPKTSAAVDAYVCDTDEKRMDEETPLVEKGEK